MDNERTQWAARMLTLPEPLQSRLMPQDTDRGYYDCVMTSS